MAIYTIYDALNEKLPTKPFLSAKTLLNDLCITNQIIQTNRNDFGIENFALNPEAFAKSFAVTLAKAGKNGETIVALDDSSFASLERAKNYILNHAPFKKEIEEMLNPMELTISFLADIAHINTLLLNNDTLKYMDENLKYSFENFKAAIYIGSELIFNTDIDKDIDAFFNVVKLKRIRFERECTPNGYSILKYAPETAFKMAGTILLDALDSGIDFLMLSDTQTFYIFDECRKKIEKVVGRTIPLYVLTPAQVALMAIGVTDKKKLGFNSHKVKPTIFG